MGIKVKHSPSARAIGETAYTIGRGQRRERDYRFATEVGLKQQALDLQAASIRNQAVARSQATGQRERESERNYGLREGELDFRRQQFDVEEQKRQEEMGLALQERIEARKKYFDENSTMGFTQSQKNMLQRIAEARTTTEQEFVAGKWTPEQMEDINQQFDKLEGMILPQRILNTEMTPQQIFDSTEVTNRTTGEKLRMNEKGGFDRIGPSFEDFAKQYNEAYKNLAMVSDTPEDVTTEQIIDYMDNMSGAFAKFNSRQTVAEQETGRLQRSAVKKLQQQKQEQEAKQQAAIEALPAMFDAMTKGQRPKSRGKVYIQPGIKVTDKVLGEEAYNEILKEAVGRTEQDGISPETVKAEFDKWWDAQYDKKRGQKFQKFQNRMEFEGARQETPEELRKLNTKEAYEKGKALGYWK
jgi:hypothetical protein